MERIFSQLLEVVENELNKEDNQLKEKLLDPIVKYLGKHLMPYMLATTIIIVLLFIMLIYIIYLTNRLQKVESMPTIPIPVPNIET